MKINGTEYEMVMTDRTPEEIGNKFKRILEDKGKPEDITELLSHYPSLPGFVGPYLLAIYFKCFDRSRKAADLMDEAISKLQSDSVSSSSKDIVDQATYHIISEPFLKQLWPQAGEIYANVERFDD